MGDWPGRSHVGNALFSSTCSESAVNWCLSANEKVLCQTAPANTAVFQKLFTTQGYLSSSWNFFCKIRSITAALPTNSSVNVLTTFHLFLTTFHLCLLFFLCSSSEGRPFRLGTGANMEKVVKMDRDMTKVRTEWRWLFNTFQGYEPVHSHFPHLFLNPV